MDNNQFLEGLYRGETKQEPPSTPSDVLKRALNKLVSYGLLSDPGAASDWANALTDKTDQEIVEGIRKAKDYKGYLTMGEFRQMCKLPRAHPSHQSFVPIESKPASKERIEFWRNKRKAEIGI